MANVDLDDLIRVASETQRKTQAETVVTVATTLIQALDDGGEACARAVLSDLLNEYEEPKQ